MLNQQQDQLYFKPLSAPKDASEVLVSVDGNPVPQRLGAALNAGGGSEHITSGASPVVASTNGLTTLTTGGTKGIETVTLANGTTQGQRKTFIIEYTTGADIPTLNIATATRIFANPWPMPKPSANTPTVIELIWDTVYGWLPILGNAPYSVGVADWQTNGGGIYTDDGNINLGDGILLGAEVRPANGANGSFTTTDGKTVTVAFGIITAITGP